MCARSPPGWTWPPDTMSSSRARGRTWWGRSATLLGLVTKNAILLVDYSKVLQARGIDRREATITAGRTRLRPIMMTTLAMIFGMLPLALALGPGGEMRAPMARAVIGGLLTSTFLTLLVVPVVYHVLDDAGAWIRREWK